MRYAISRFEEHGDSLFICINSLDKPVYLEHFFTEDEKKDQKGTIEKLVAELEVRNDEYVAPKPMISKLEEAKAIALDGLKIASAKVDFLAKREAEKTEPVEEHKG